MISVFSLATAIERGEVPSYLTPRKSGRREEGKRKEKEGKRQEEETKVCV